ncbi:polyadenylate-binding protein [Skeletonema marinoi]|uniref:Polyadenylate-binding protein n=1 Tax=Skeletonema marinoi TaxID=267567 RepID=A0AAD9DIX6_9STRA|nr:polyadenylate-binding protein [Skeletonema marinoi]
MSTEEKEPVAAKEEEEEEEEDLEKLQAEIARMEAEAARIAQETEDLDKSTSAGAAASTSAAAEGKKSEADTASKDGHSIYVGQVDYSTTPEELLAHFESCGTVERVTLVCDKFTGKPKGFAYLEFQTDAAVENAIKLDGSTFKERQLKVTPKRVNDPNFYVQQGGGYQGRGGGRGFRGRGRGRGRGGGRGGYGRGGGRGFRGRGRGYNPY